MMTRRYARGFTLIELMIVVAIVAILAAVAYPAYTDSVLKGRRAEARAALLDLMQQQERYMTQRNTYLKFSNVGGTTDPTSVPFKVYSGDSPTSAGTSYWLSAAECTGQLVNECINLTATPAKTNDPAVGALSLSSTGQKTCSGTAASSNPKLCWP